MPVISLIQEKTKSMSPTLRFINVLAGFIMFPMWNRQPPTAKFGAVGLTKPAALELACLEIRMNAICTGGIASGIYSRIYPTEMSAELIERAPDEIVAPYPVYRAN